MFVYLGVDRVGFVGVQSKTPCGTMPVHGELLIANGIMYLDRLDTMREICEILVNLMLVAHSEGRFHANCLESQSPPLQAFGVF